MKNILVLGNSAIGLYKFRKEVVQALRTHYRVTIAVPDNGFSAELERAGIAIRVTPLDRRGMNPIKDFVLLWRYFSLVRQYKPDVILTYTVKPNIYGNFIARVTRVPVITTITGTGDAFDSQGMGSQLVRLLYKLALQKTKVVMFQNRVDRKQFETLGIIHGKQSVHSVPGSGVNMSDYPALAYPTAVDPTFLFVGRKLKSKGIEHILNATYRLKEKYAFRMVLVGPNEEQADLNERIAQAVEDGVIENIGLTNHVEAYIADAHCILMPSYKEGMSNVILEGAASGRPILTTNVAGCREAVDPDVTGLLCEARNDDAVYAMMERFINMNQAERELMGLRARHFVEQRFDRQLVIEQVLASVEELLGDCET